MRVDFIIIIIIIIIIILFLFLFVALSFHSSSSQNKNTTKNTKNNFYLGYPDLSLNKIGNAAIVVNIPLNFSSSLKNWS
jgi:flagellar basal body-associated protein FliL